MPIPIIDLFAGPGGLGEGFSSLLDKKGNPAFEIKLSIEKDEWAHKTLTWRAFYRQFKNSGRIPPKEYYEAYRESNLKNREVIIESALNEYEEGKSARNEAQLIELGSKSFPSEFVDELIFEKLPNRDKPWVLIGGPPCQAYSNAGRSRVGGINPEDHRVYLYKEYLRIIDVHRPSIFVMENVKGLLSAKVNGDKVFDWIKKDLELDGSYKIFSFVKNVKKDSDFLIKSELYGIPQKRHRVILLGIRSDFKHPNIYLKKSAPIQLKEVIGNLPPVRSGLNRSFVRYKSFELSKAGKPKREYLKLNDSDTNWRQLMLSQIQTIRNWGELSMKGIELGPGVFQWGKGKEFISGVFNVSENDLLNNWFKDSNLGGVANHESRSHLTQDLMRYLFASLYIQDHDSFPRMEDYARHHQTLVPDHSSALSGKFSDRFRVQLPEIPATTITSHISKDGHYFIHYDPRQCRSLTVREAARIQTFPDNYLFRGSRTQQFHQVGNAVPPYLALQLAEIVEKVINPNSDLISTEELSLNEALNGL